MQRIFSQGRLLIDVYFVLPFYIVFSLLKILEVESSVFSLLENFFFFFLLHYCLRSNCYSNACCCWVTWNQFAAFVSVYLCRVLYCFYLRHNMFRKSIPFHLFLRHEGYLHQLFDIFYLSELSCVVSCSNSINKFHLSLNKIDNTTDEYGISM